MRFIFPGEWPSNFFPRFSPPPQIIDGHPLSRNLRISQKQPICILFLYVSERWLRAMPFRNYNQHWERQKTYNNIIHELCLSVSNNGFQISSSAYDSGHAKKVLTYWEKRGKSGKLCSLQGKYLHSTHGKLYIFGKRETSSFQKYIVFHGHYGDIYLTVIMISPFFPIR